MKNMLSLFAIVCLFGTAATCQQKVEVKSIEFSKVSRGYDEKVSLARDSLHFWMENNRGEKPKVDYAKKLTADEWTSLMMIVKNIDLEEIPTLPSPTMKRAVDAAMHSTITINTSDGKSYAHGFDDEDPHKLLVPLLKRIREISGSAGK